QAGGQRRPLDRERVVARRGESVRDRREYALAVVSHARDLAMHDARCPDYSTAESLPDRLMAQADAEDRDLAPELRDGAEGNAGFVGRAGTGRDDDARRFKPGRRIQVDFVVAHYLDFRAQLAQIL